MTNETKQATGEAKFCNGIAATLRAYRARNKATQETVAKEIGVSVPTLSAIESGKRASGITLARLYRFAEFYGVTVAELVEP